MSLHQECQMLRNVPMFAGLDGSKLKLLSFASDRVSFMPGEEFIHQGERGEDAYLILDGTAEVVVETNHGEVAMSEMGSNHLVGIIAVLHNGLRTATVRAKTDVVCLKLPKDVFFHLIRDLPDFALAVMRELADTVDRTTLQLREAVSAADRLKVN
jgi:CRP-like cAMP-binding protein